MIQIVFLRGWQNNKILTRSRYVLFKVWLNTAWKETLYEIIIMAFLDERSLIQSFTQVRGRNNCYTLKTELQSIRSSADLTAISMISHLWISYICSDFSCSTFQCCKVLFTTVTLKSTAQLSLHSQFTKLSIILCQKCLQLSIF